MIEQYNEKGSNSRYFEISDRIKIDKIIVYIKKLKKRIKQLEDVIAVNEPFELDKNAAQVDLSPEAMEKFERENK